MRFKLLIVALVSSLVAVSGAVAKDHPGKGKPATTGAHCRPAVTVMLKGTLGPNVDPADGDTSFVMLVKHSNRFGRAYEKAGSATIAVDPKTKIRRQGAHNLGALAPGDRLLVLAKACKADLANGATPNLTARMIAAHPAKSA
ncbi:MAG: hypothetical protein WBB76_08685 [Gaiellaceae bacterium]